ncbi:hypothetical protein J6590_024215 [Homalodisca vitripennis]|nr:hypothetical protein J6590_024215 [Homalodisca vitripennis]
MTVQRRAAATQLSVTVRCKSRLALVTVSKLQLLANQLSCVWTAWLNEEARQEPQHGNQWGKAFDPFRTVRSVNRENLPEY